MRKRTRAAEGGQTLFADDAPAPAKPTVAPPKTKNEVATRQAAPKLPVSAEPKSLLTAVFAAVLDPKCDPAKMNALLDIRERIMREQAKVGYHRAYRAAKLEMPRIDKDGKIDEGQTRSGRQGKNTRYATYENINTIIAPILEKHGLDLTLHAEPKPSGEGILMRATLSYVATTDYGEMVYSESNVVPMPPEPGQKNAAQAVSSALSYAKRNAVVLALNLISYAPQDRDTDGNKPLAPQTIETNAVTLISKKQETDLVAAIKDCGVGTDTFCNKYEIERVQDLPANLFDDAMAACRNFKANRAKGAESGDPRG